MTEFMNKSFSVGMAGDQQYRDNWERIFGKKKELEPVEEHQLCTKHHLKVVRDTCPYDVELYECDDLCSCCPECRQECMDDI